MTFNEEREGPERPDTGTAKSAAGAEDSAGGPQSIDETRGSADAGGGGAENGERAKKDAWDWGISDVQNVVSDIMGSLKNLPSLSARAPGHDLLEVPHEGYWVLMDVPGVEKADIDVSMVGDELTISGARERPELPEGSEVLASGRAYGRFRRQIRMPGDVDHDGVKARLESGVLKVILPRRAEQGRQRVEVEE